MASIRKYNGKWRAEIFKLGVRRSKIFPTKQAARDWSARQEYLIENGDVSTSRETFGNVLDRYIREVSPGKRSHRWELIKAECLKRDKIAQFPLGDLAPRHFSDWRDRRLREVTAGTVIREMGFMSAVLSVARRDWDLIKVNPISDVRRPAQPPARDRLPTTAEFDRLAEAAGSDLSFSTARTYHAFLFACETAMRAGEICGLTWDRVDLKRRVATLDRTKNGSSRDVPLSTGAVKLLEALPPLDPVFGLSVSSCDALFRKLKTKAKIIGLNFHDSRHYAITKLSRKLDVLALARMVGHKNIGQLQTYYNEGAEELAKRLG